MELKVDKSTGLMYIISGNGWKKFCAANEISAGESLILELIRGGVTPLLKFISKVSKNVKLLAFHVLGFTKLKLIK